MISYKKEANTKKQVDKILHPLVKEWFEQTFPAYSLPQLFTVLEIHSRKNVLLSAPTGATKTLTSFLSILNELVDNATKNILEDKTYAIYVSPLKALNRDIEKNLKKPLEEIKLLAANKNIAMQDIRIGVRTGDTSQSERQKMTRNCPHILITTPESLAILLQVRSWDKKLADVQWMLVDEIHALAENKRGVHLSLTIERLQDRCPAMARVGLSATVAPLDEVAQFLVGTDRDCLIVDVPMLKQLDLDVMTPVHDLVNADAETMENRTYEMLDELIQQHKTTLIFTNTRAGTERVVHNLKQKYPKNYYETGEEPPYEVASLIGAHHGSLSKLHRHDIENKLKEGKLRAVVCSTSLELGIDIGYIDLVVILGSPKSVARLLQRVGRAGHQLHETAKGKIIVTSRDDLLECSVMQKFAKEKYIDRIHIPKNCLDVMIQHILAMALEEPKEVKHVYSVIKQAYPYKDVQYDDVLQAIDYLAGKYGRLEDRHVYAKIWHENGAIGKRGKMTQPIYLQNLGTIVQEGGVTVKIGDYQVGSVDEAFLEKLKRGDRFVLGGESYEFRFARGMVAQVVNAHGKKPTVPSWFSDMLPLSYDVADGIGKFRKHIYNMLKAGDEKEVIIKEIEKYLYLNSDAAIAIYNYLLLQYTYTALPTSAQLVIEEYKEEDRHYTFVLGAYGRRCIDALAKIIAFVIGRQQHRDVEIGLTDHGFYLAATKYFDVQKALQNLQTYDLEELGLQAIDKSEVLKRRFRHCAVRGLMILTTYKGKTKRVGRQQVSSTVLLSTVRSISNDFILLREARREVLFDAMAVDEAQKVIDDIRNRKVTISKHQTVILSPNATQLYVHGKSDLLTIEQKQDFVKRMQQMVVAKIALNEGKAKKPKKKLKPADYKELWSEEVLTEDHTLDLLDALSATSRRLYIDDSLLSDLQDLINGKRQNFSKAFVTYLTELTKDKKPEQYDEKLFTYLQHVVEFEL